MIAMGALTIREKCGALVRRTFLLRKAGAMATIPPEYLVILALILALPLMAVCSVS